MIIPRLERKCEQLATDEPSYPLTGDGPLISVITVVRNGERYIEQAITSVVGQSYPNVEYIVIDGGSTDGTMSIVRRYEEKIDVVVSEPDKGIYDAMNKGLGLATGDLVSFLNSDDWYEDGALEEVARLYRKGAVVAGAWRIHLGDVGMTIESKPSFRFHQGMSINHQSMFVPMECHRRLGNYDLEYRFASDLDMLLRLHNAKVPFVFSDTVLVNFRATGASDTHYEKSVREASSIIRRHKGLGTYAAYRIVRFKFEVLTKLSKWIEARLGKDFSNRLKRIYFRAVSSVSPTWKGGK